jgi:hypothetical protein
MIYRLFSALVRYEIVEHSRALQSTIEHQDLHGSHILADALRFLFSHKNPPPIKLFIAKIR